ncbi:replication initiation and membrane attachment family protein [Streptococcus pyogenes]|uniref:replication initiation and membrane attachment family protein n=1 Tax=Streptococcus pyogenes TaxID=1314 RepID=UPI0010A1F64C|nr:replication initiation and membrane attachment family protein [Streptococcus pyogenes]HER5377734.1 replication initiation and membrane attachment family protein [Streptococcus pyogenes]
MMKPIDTFTYLKRNKVTLDSVTLIQLYFPIIGSDAVSIYQYFIHFFDDGLQRHKFSDILNHLQFGMKRFEDALAILTAMELVSVYQLSDTYLITLHQPLSRDLFFQHPAYSRLLEQKIGEVAVSELQVTVPSQARNISKRFSDIFGVQGDLTNVPQKPQKNFDLSSFQQLMVRDGLQFEDNQKDIISLYSIAEQYDMTWFDTYQIAKATAVNGKIRPERLLTKKNQSMTKPSKENFSQAEQIILREAKQDSALVFLEKIKKARRATITKDERILLQTLAKMNFLDDVINVMVLYTFNKTKSANLQKSYVLKMANDFAYQKVSTAEEAIVVLRAFTDRQSRRQSKVKTSQSNVPKWSNPDYQETTSQEEQAKLDQFKQAALKRLENLGKGGD